MNYVILHYFFMVQICIIKVSANSIRHKSNSNYDIDDFIIKLMASQKFDELAEKVADKAASKMKNLETPPARQEKFLDTNKLNKTAEAQQNYRDQSNREYEKEYEKANSFNNNIKLRNHNPQPKGKINTLAVMLDETTSRADSLRLKYKYLTRNAYEKKVFSERTAENPKHKSILRNNKNEDTPIQNEKKDSAEERTQDHDSKIEAHTSNQDLTKNEFVEDENRWRHERESDRKDPDYNRSSNKHENPHMDAEREENTKNKDHSHEGPGSRDEREQRHDQNHSREKQSSRPEFKSVVKNQIEKTNVDNSTTDEQRHISVEGENQESQENNPPSEEEKNNEEVEKAETEKEEAEKSATEENVEEDELSPMHFRAQSESEAQEDPDVEKNKVTFDDDNQDGEDHAYHKSDEDPSFSTNKPVIRREGNKLYTFVEAPGYEDYHEEVAKLAKSKGPNEFIL